MRGSSSTRRRRQTTWRSSWSTPVLVSYALSSSLVKFGGTDDLEVRHTPLLGQDNREVLRDAGYSPAEIEELYATGVATTESPD